MDRIINARTALDGQRPTMATKIPLLTDSIQACSTTFQRVPNRHVTGYATVTHGGYEPNRCVTINIWTIQTPQCFWRSKLTPISFGYLSQLASPFQFDFHSSYQHPSQPDPVSNQHPSALSVQPSIRAPRAFNPSLRVYSHSSVTNSTSGPETTTPRETTSHTETVSNSNILTRQ